MSAVEWHTQAVAQVGPYTLGVWLDVGGWFHWYVAENDELRAAGDARSEGDARKAAEAAARGLLS